ncbi:MAG TPA: Hsp20/alpha crystallin family protein [Spirochaetia bacterium]|nr:Hsp20/alpha crystallin family protein [Spirochaetia bacterium]
MKSLMTYEPKYTSLFDDMDRIFGSFFDDGFEVRTPAVDVREEDDRYMLEAELTGLSEKDVDVRVHDGLLTISSKKEENKEEKKEGYILKERRSSGFSRSFLLPKDVDQEKIDAAFANGLLTLTLPKQEKSLPKTIEVKTK